MKKKGVKGLVFKDTVVLCRWGVEMNVWFINRVKVNWPPQRYSSAEVSSVNPSPSCDSILFDEELTLETSAFESLYGGQFTLRNETCVLTLQLINALTAEIRAQKCISCTLPCPISTKLPIPLFMT